MGERLNPRRKKTPSFSSSLLDSIFLSIDESHDSKKVKSEVCSEKGGFFHGRKLDNYTVEVEEESKNLRREIMANKWMKNYLKGTRSLKQFKSDSSSSSAEHEDSKSAPKQRISDFLGHKKGTICEFDSIQKHDNKQLFMNTESKALKIYGDLKKMRQPISPGGKFTNFLNSFLFNTRRNLSISGIKSKSVKDSNTSRPCLDKPASSSLTNKSKRSVTFCPVSVIVDEDCQPCGHKNIYDNLEYGSGSFSQRSRIGSQFVKNSIIDYGVKHSYEYHHHFNEDDVDDDDGDSCTSSDLFELDNIVIEGMGSNKEELPVYGTTKLTRNHTVATMMVV